MTARDEILSHLRELGIPFALVEHPPVRAIGDCRWAEAQLGGLMPKNLFLTPRNRSAFTLCLVRPESVFRTSDVSRQLGSARLSFAGDGDLMRHLRTDTGAVSPMGLVFPEAQSVRLAMDERLRDEPRLLFHPNDRDATLALSNADFFERFLPATGHCPTFIHIAPPPTASS